MNESFRYVALDIETTGLSPRKGHRMIEIGAVAIEEGCMTEEFESLVSVERKISPKVQRIHGISNDMLINQPKFGDIFPRLQFFLKDSIIIAHNAWFDMDFLRREAGRLSMTLNNRYICTMEMSKKRYPGLLNYKLDTVYRHLFGEIPPDIRRHRALDDARMAARIWMEMVKR
ncbi:MAG: 3'-5' exonuclease [Deltaproteobacteria bacterium]|nr:3'-5' exonuclease [Deltaproteobacteria bacterium]